MGRKEMNKFKRWGRALQAGGIARAEGQREVREEEGVAQS